jgi:AcrR family transcriptional regulator
MARRNPTVRQTKQQVAEAAFELFCQRGYHGVTVEDIAAAAGVTKGAFYYYYSDKDDLATDLWHDVWTRLTEQAEAAYDPRADVATNLKACFRTLLEDIANLGQARFFLRDTWLLPGVEVAGRTEQAAAAQLFGSLLSAARTAGELADLEVDAASHVLLGAYAEGVLHIVTTGDPGPTLAVLDAIVDTMVPGANGRRPGGSSPEARRSRSPAVRSPAVRSPAVRSPAVRSPIRTGRGVARSSNGVTRP